MVTTCSECGGDELACECPASVRGPAPASRCDEDTTTPCLCFAVAGQRVPPSRAPCPRHGDGGIAARRDPELTVRAHAERSVSFLIRELLERKDELVELAVARASSIGAAEYGDAAWQRSPAELSVEVDEELADALFYAGVRFDNTGVGSAG